MLEKQALLCYGSRAIRALHWQLMRWRHHRVPSAYPSVLPAPSSVFLALLVGPYSLFTGTGKSIAWFMPGEEEEKGVSSEPPPPPKKNRQTLFSHSHGMAMAYYSLSVLAHGEREIVKYFKNIKSISGQSIWPKWGSGFEVLHNIEGKRSLPSTTIQHIKCWRLGQKLVSAT